MIKHSNLSDKVYDILLKRIIIRKIKPGEKLIEDDLAENLGISHTPIREALNRLYRDDLVELIPQSGGYIRKLTAREVQEVYEVREVLESLAVRLYPVQMKTGKGQCPFPITVFNQSNLSSDIKLLRDFLTSDNNSAPKNKRNPFPNSSKNGKLCNFKFPGPGWHEKNIDIVIFPSIKPTARILP
mgnify:CR=1 FL=1